MAEDEIPEEAHSRWRREQQAARQVRRQRSLAVVALDPAQLRYQVSVARRVMRRRYGTAVDWFCDPSGSYDDAVVAEVKAAGYLGATTVVPGVARNSDDPYRLPRLLVLGGTTPAELLAMIADSRYVGPAPEAYPG